MMSGLYDRIRCTHQQDLDLSSHRGIHSTGRGSSSICVACAGSMGEERGRLRKVCMPQVSPADLGQFLKTGISQDLTTVVEHIVR